MIRPHDESMLELAALRAIDALESDEAAIIDRHMAECPECRAEFARSRVAGTALAFAAATPAPAALRERVLRSAVKVRRIEPLYRRPAFRFAAATAAAAIVIAGSWLLTHRGGSEQHILAHCALPAAHCSGEVVATRIALHLEAHAMPALPPGRVWQAWIIHPNEAPIPEPTFTTTAQGDGTVDIPAGASKGDIVAVTAEPAGGSKSPTSKPVLVATIE